MVLGLLAPSLASAPAASPTISAAGPTSTSNSSSSPSPTIASPAASPVPKSPASAPTAVSPASPAGAPAASGPAATADGPTSSAPADGPATSSDGPASSSPASGPASSADVPTASSPDSNGPSAADGPAEAPEEGVADSGTSILRCWTGESIKTRRLPRVGEDFYHRFPTVRDIVLSVNSILEQISIGIALQNFCFACHLPSNHMINQTESNKASCTKYDRSTSGNDQSNGRKKFVKIKPTSVSLLSLISHYISFLRERLANTTQQTDLLDAESYRLQDLEENYNCCSYEIARRKRNDEEEKKMGLTKGIAATLMIFVLLVPSLARAPAAAPTTSKAEAPTSSNSTSPPPTSSADAPAPDAASGDAPVSSPSASLGPKKSPAPASAPTTDSSAVTPASGPDSSASAPSADGPTSSSPISSADSPTSSSPASSLTSDGPTADSPAESPADDIADSGAFTAQLSGIAAVGSGVLAAVMLVVQKYCYALTVRMTALRKI
ncbi:flocculation protein FLO11-like [Aristolochia californica]|uniref:flocculation protein FLO11-like n=1 Tax=Aristolochia californica TaxID=171875 RepID=UPI0035DBE490